MWNLELHIEIIKSGWPGMVLNGELEFEGLSSVQYSEWKVIESKEIFSELDQWQTVSAWKTLHNLHCKHNYFICLSRISHGVNNYNEKEINGHGFAAIAG